MKLSPLKYRNSDSGNCRVYYTSERTLYCLQQSKGEPFIDFEFYLCSKDGEPECGAFLEYFLSIDIPPLGSEHPVINYEVRAYLIGLDIRRSMDQFNNFEVYAIFNHAYTSARQERDITGPAYNDRLEKRSQHILDKLRPWHTLRTGKVGL